MSRPPSRAQVRRLLLRLAGPVVSALGAVGQRHFGVDGAASPDRPRILLIRPDHLGDLLLASPAAGVLREALPDAQIDWLTGPWAAEVARRCGGGGDVLTLPFPGFTRAPKASLLEPYRLLVTQAARLRARQYDAALILRADHWWGALLTAAAGIPIRFGYAVPECRPFLTDMLSLPTGPDRHAVVMNQELARLAGSRLGGRTMAASLVSPSFPVSDDERDWAATWVAGAHPEPAEPLVVLHAGSGAVLKNWPPERWAAVVDDLRTSHRVRVVLTGGPSERTLLDDIAARLDPAPPVLAGATTLGQLAGLYAQADLVLGGDSGPLHLAAAVQTPTVRVYGPTDTAEFGPWPASPQQVAVAANLPCQPCRAIVNPPCGATERPACLQAVEAVAVTSAARAILAARGALESNAVNATPRGGR